MDVKLVLVGLFLLYRAYSLVTRMDSMIQMTITAMALPIDSAEWVETSTLKI